MIYLLKTSMQGKEDTLKIKIALAELPPEHKKLFFMVPVDETTSVDNFVKTQFIVERFMRQWHEENVDVVIIGNVRRTDYVSKVFAWGDEERFPLNLKMHLVHEIHETEDAVVLRYLNNYYTRADVQETLTETTASLTLLAKIITANPDKPIKTYEEFFGL